MNKKNILVIIVDCLRADYVSGGALIPNTLKLRKDGISFTQAVSTTSITSPNIADILTGCYPFEHGIKSLYGYKLNPAIRTLAEILKDSGYHTAALTTGPLLPEIGLDRGFDIYQYRDAKYDFGFGLEERVNKVLDTIPSPWFIMLHTWITHAPRRIPKQFDNNIYGKNRYDKAVSVFDWYLGLLLQRINLDDTFVLLTGDHGENLKSGSFLDYLRLLVGLAHNPSSNPRLNRVKIKLIKLLRDIRTKYNMAKDGALTPVGHGFHVYDNLIKVPLIMVGQGLNSCGSDISALVRHIDIMPTVLEFNKIYLPESYKIHGRSLLSLLKGASIEEEGAFLMASGEGLISQDNWLYGIRDSFYKYIFSISDKYYEELYNLKDDPQERYNLAKKYPQQAAILRKKTEEIMKDCKMFLMDDEEKSKIRKALEELGYL